MNVLDWVLIGIGAFCIVRGLMRGAVSQLFGIAGILAGFYVASNHYEGVAAQILKSFPGLTAAGTIAFILLFVLTWICVSIAGFWVGKMMRRVGLGFLDRLWGGMIGLGKGLIFSIIAISFLMLFTSASSPLLRGSLLTPYVQEASRFLVKLAPESVQKKYQEKHQELERFLSGTKAVSGGEAAPESQPAPKKGKEPHDSK
jgi:membrane protein required for colicin V production